MDVRFIIGCTTLCNGFNMIESFINMFWHTVDVVLNRFEPRKHIDSTNKSRTWVYMKTWIYLCVLASFDQSTAGHSQGVLDFDQEAFVCQLVKIHLGDDWQFWALRFYGFRFVHKDGRSQLIASREYANVSSGIPKIIPNHRGLCHVCVIVFTTLPTTILSSSIIIMIFMCIYACK